MLEAGFEFKQDIDDVVMAFTKLRSHLRPTHLSSEERIVKTSVPIEAAEKTGNFISKNKYGFFLLGDGVTYSLRIGSGHKISCDCFIEHSPQDVESLVYEVAEAQPMFGFACLREEHNFRNRAVIKQGINTIESWVGRDTDRYIPGLYWITLISNLLILKHEVPIDVLSQTSEYHTVLATGQYFFRFYPKPSDWDKVSSVSNLIAEEKCIFSIRDLKVALSEASNYKEVSEVTGRWK